MDATQFHDAVVSRGGRFSLSGTNVRVRGASLTLAELQQMQTLEADLARLIYTRQQRQPLAEEAPLLARNEEAVYQQIAAWKASCLRSKGYDWNLKSWLTEQRTTELQAAAEAYIAGTATLADLHRVFLDYAKAHRLTTEVLVNGGRPVSTVTPQVQPQAADLARAARLLGYGDDVRAFASACGYQLRTE